MLELPCKIGAEVYTVNEDYFPCHVCEDKGYTDTNECYTKSSRPPYDAPRECPTVYEIQTHICQGFSVGNDENGNPTSGLAGEWGCEGLEIFYGEGMKQFYSMEYAEWERERLTNEAEAKEVPCGQD